MKVYVSSAGEAPVIIIIGPGYPCLLSVNFRVGPPVANVAAQYSLIQYWLLGDEISIA